MQFTEETIIEHDVDAISSGERRVEGANAYSRASRSEGGIRRAQGMGREG